MDYHVLKELPIVMMSTLRNNQEIFQLRHKMMDLRTIIVRTVRLATSGIILISYVFHVKLQIASPVLMLILVMCVWIITSLMMVLNVILYSMDVLYHRICIPHNIFPQLTMETFTVQNVLTVFILILIFILAPHALLIVLNAQAQQNVLVVQGT